MKLSRDEYGAVLRGDLATFIEASFRELNPQREFLPNWHIDLIADALNDCRLGKIRRLIICVPPRSLKSHCVSVAFTAWLLGLDPTAQILCASYSQVLVEKHAWDTRNLMTSPLYDRTFRTRISKQRFATSDFATTKGGQRFATSVGGTVTGRGADFIILDDPLKPDEALSDTQRQAANDWFDHSLYSRLNDKRTGRIIIIMQRLHEDDLVGHVQKAGGWTTLRLPAIAEEDETHSVRTLDGQSKIITRKAGEALHPEREPVEALDDVRETVGTYNFAAQYQQAPAPPEGALIKIAWFKTYTEDQLPEKFELKFQSWDTANKVTELSDYSVCTTWGRYQGRLYLLDVLRKRLEFPELRRLVPSHAELWQASTVLIEDKASGTQLIQDLGNEGFDAPIPYSSSLDKVMRLQTVSPIVEAGKVYLPERAHWLADYLHEMAMFPKGKHDDQVDSTSQALDWVRNKRTPRYGLLEYYDRIEQELTSRKPGTEYAELLTRPRGAPNDPYATYRPRPRWR